MICECVLCCDGEHPGKCIECHGMGYIGDDCTSCNDYRDCAKCRGVNKDAKQLAMQIVAQRKRLRATKHSRETLGVR